MSDTPASASSFEIHETTVLAFEGVVSERRTILRRDPGGDRLVGERSTSLGSTDRAALHLHVPDGTPSPTIGLRWTSGNGFQIVERWPRVAADGDGWTRLVVRNGGCERVSYPSPTDPVCETTDGRCESADAESSFVEGSACLVMPDAEARHLSYRATVARAKLPIDVHRRGESWVVARAAGERPIRLVRIVRGRDGTTTGFVAFDAPPVDAPIALPTPSAAGSEARAEFVAPIATIGLSDGERRMFERRVSHDAFEPEGAGGLLDALYYFLPAEEIDALLPIDATPPPSATRRAVLVRIGLEFRDPLPRPRIDRPTIRVRTDGLPTVSGGVVDAHRRVVLDRVADLEACAERAYRPGRLIAERLVVRYEVAQDGHVRTATVDDPVGSDRIVAACTEAAFLSFVFPETRSPVALGRIPISILALPPRP